MTIDPGGTGRPPVVTWVLLGSFAADRDEPLHRLIRAARAGDPEATASILGAVGESAGSLGLKELTDALVVPVPGHAVDSVPPLVEALARGVARVTGWTYAEGALVRRRATTEAKLGGPRRAVTEASTLEWRAPQEAAAIVLVDDVIRSGMTLTACLQAIRSSGDPRDVIAVTIAAARVGG